MCVVGCTAAAALLGHSAWAAACGSGVVLVMWAIEKAAVRAGSEGSFGHGMAVGLGGMMARMALALAVLVTIGVAASRRCVRRRRARLRGDYTVYNIVRLWWHPAVPDAVADDDLKKRSA